MKTRILQALRERFGIQVLVAFTTIILLVSISFISLLVRFQYTGMMQSLEDNGKLITEMFSYQSRIPLFSENRYMLQVSIETPFQNPSVTEASVYGPDKKIILQKFGPAQTEATNQVSQKELADIFSQIEQTSAPLIFHYPDYIKVWESVKLGDSFMIWKPPYEVGRFDQKSDSPIGYVEVTIGKGALREQLRQAVLNIIGMGLAFLALAALVTFFLVKQIEQPIKQLTEGVRQFGVEGKCDSLPTESKNEIGKLAKAFQEMSGALSDHIRKEVETTQELAHSRNLVQLGVASSKITHEVGGLLNTMHWVLNSMKEETFSPIGEKRLMLLEKEADRLQSFITDFLQFAKKPIIQKRKGHLSWIFQEVFSTHQSQADQKGISLILEWPDNLPPIDADHWMLCQAIHNLVSNSIFAIEKNGVIKISGSMTGTELIITIDDTGQGIDPLVVDKIFEAFFTTKGRNGTGLGLAIVKSVIQAHGGSISCQSHPGEGTCFTVCLPISA